MNAEEVKQALRQRHPATQTIGAKVVPGVWTCVEEWSEIDLLAVSSYKTPPSGAQRKSSPYPRVGYEVKVSRSDLRRELLSPGKRLRYHLLCNELYLAVPEGLLKSEEIAYAEPDWQPGDFERVRCPERCRRAELWMGKHDRKRHGLTAGTHLAPNGGGVPLPEPCPTCRGRGYTGKSRVELQAPTLWVPRDLGLVCVSADGRCEVVRRSPVREVAPLDAAQLADLVRWVSARPDPRHEGLVEQARRVGQRRRRG